MEITNASPCPTDAVSSGSWKVGTHSGGGGSVCVSRNTLFEPLGVTPAA
jgi:hypothetical protein